MAEYTQSKSVDLALTLLRMVAGSLFMLHGAQKLFGLFGGLGGNETSAPLLTLMWFAGVLEFFGGLCILLGLFTRPVAFLLSGEMAVAYFKAHAPRGFLPLLNHGEAAVLYCFIFFFLAVAGGGQFTLDELRRKKES
jgi:putative oxidoreductase